APKLNILQPVVQSPDRRTLGKIHPMKQLVLDIVLVNDYRCWRIEAIAAKLAGLHLNDIELALSEQLVQRSLHFARVQAPALIGYAAEYRYQLGQPLASRRAWNRDYFAL